MNREIYPGGIYPLQGDVVSQAGSNTVEIAAIQGAPVAASVPANGAYLLFDGLNWVDRQPWNDSIEVNGVSVSDDYNVSVNVSRPIKINGV